MKLRSRRDFLRTATASAAALAIAHKVPAYAAGFAAPSSAVKVWGTFRDQRHADRPSLEWKRASQVAADAIQLDTAASRQEILGFGAAITEASAYMLSRLTDAERAPVMHDLFAPDAMALNVCRTCIGSSDYATKVYSYDESSEPDPDLKKFSIDHDKQFYLPILREARKQNPDLFLFSSPWSPPGWMKPNNSMIGGAMRKLSFGPYAQYFVKFLDAYKAEGVDINAVTVQNETDAEQEGHMSACLWAQEQEMEFAARFLSPAIRKAGMNTKIWLLDHNYSLWGRAVDELSDPSVYEAVDGIAWHGYVGEPTAMTRVHDAFPAKNALIGLRAVPTSISPTTRLITQSGPINSTAYSTTGRDRSRPGMSRSTKKENRISGRSHAGASSPSTTRPTKSQPAASIGHLRTIPSTSSAAQRYLPPMRWVT